MHKFLPFSLAVSIVSLPLFATNGDNFISLGVPSTGMGGTGIAHFSIGSSATGNPALITASKGGEFTFGGTYLAPSVKVTTSNTVGNDLTASSDAKQNTTPYAALTHNLGNGFSVGGSMFGSAGMGTDWTQGEGAINLPQVGLYSMKSSLTMLKISAPVAYQTGNWSFGAAPVMVFGTLEMSYISPTSGPIGEKPASDTGFGLELGTLYHYSPLGLSVGAVYHSPISLTYENQLSTVSSGFGYGGAGSNFAPFSDELEQPAEMGIGMDWTMGNISLSADYRNIRWGEAAGYKDFNWENQSVYAIGGEYRFENLSVRCGYNYGKNPIKPNSDNSVVVGTVRNGDVINAFNHVMFPAITQRHYTLGAGYKFNKAVSADLAVVYATSPEVTVSASSVGLGDITVTNDQLSASAAFNVVF